MIRLILQVFCAIFSGCLQALAISNDIFPFGAPFIALFCLVPMYIALQQVKSYRVSFMLFAIQALTVHLFSSSWLANFHDFAIFTLGASAFGTALEAALCGIFFLVPYKRQTLSSKLQEFSGKNSILVILRPLWFSACWIFWEWIKSVGFLGYPWGTLSMAAYRWKIFTQIADITGVWGVSFIYALFSAFIGEGIVLLSNSSRYQNTRNAAKAYSSIAKFTLTVFAICGAYGLFQYFIPRIPQKYVNTVIVQQNIDSWESDEDISILTSQKLTQQGINQFEEMDLQPDLVLWSEGILNRSFPSAVSYYRKDTETESLKSFISRMGVPFIIGGRTTVNREKRHYSNAAVLFDSNGEYSGFYNKIHLVPFAEQIPLAENPIVQTLMKKIVGFSSGWTPGTQFVLFKIPISDAQDLQYHLECRPENYYTLELDEYGFSDEETKRYFTNNSPYVAFTTPICFEDSFNDVCSRLYNMGSEVFMNITNDSWSETAPAEYQHYIAASYRAIEYRTTLVRCGNAGYSVVVDPSGKVLADLPVFQEAVLSYPVPIYSRHATFYSKYGDWFAVLCILLIAACCLYCYLLVLKEKNSITSISIHFEEKKEADSELKQKSPSQEESEFVQDTTTSVPEQKIEVSEKNTRKKSTAKSVASRAPGKKSEEKTSVTRKITTKKATESKTAAKTAATKKTVTKKSSELKTAAKATTANKTAEKKPVTRKTAAKKSTGVKNTEKQTPQRKTTAKKSTVKKTVDTKSQK